MKEPLVQQKHGTSGPWVLDDRAFFERNKAKSWRLRSPFEHELFALECDGCGRLIETLKQNALERDEFVIFVVKFTEHVRLRLVCLKRKHGKVLSAGPSRRSNPTIHLAEYTGDELARAVRETKLDDFDFSPKHPNLDKCPVCELRFRHGEVDAHVTMPGVSTAFAVHPDCLDSLPEESMLVGWGMYAEADRDLIGEDLERLKKLGEYTDGLWKASKQ